VHKSGKRAAALKLQVQIQSQGSFINSLSQLLADSYVAKRNQEKADCDADEYNVSHFASIS